MTNQQRSGELGRAQAPSKPPTGFLQRHKRPLIGLTVGVVVLGIALAVVLWKVLSPPDIFKLIRKECIRPEMMALTFDDGPGENTDGILDVLEQLGVKATFFVNGDHITSLHDPKIAATLRRTHQLGHQIASHTYSHPDLATLDADQIRSEMLRLDNMTAQLIGVRPTYMRPPFGSINKLAMETIDVMNYTVVTWNLDTNDWRYPDTNQQALRAYRKALKKPKKSMGIIALQHDTARFTNGAFVEKVVGYARAAGKRLVRVDECLGAPGSAYR